MLDQVNAIDAYDPAHGAEHETADDMRRLAALVIAHTTLLDIKRAHSGKEPRAASQRDLFSVPGKEGCELETELKKNREKSREQALAEMAIVHTSLKAAGFTIHARADYADKQKRPIAMLAIGAAPIGENSSNIVQWVTDSLPSSVYWNYVQPSQFRTAETGRDPAWSILTVDETEGCGADDDDPNESSTKEVTWQFSVPSEYCLSEDEPDTALLDRLPPLPFTDSEFDCIWDATGGNPEFMIPMLEAAKAGKGIGDDADTAQIVTGLLAAGTVHVLVGDAGIGKSTLMQQIATAVASGRDEVLGYEIPERARGRTGVLLTGEDNNATIGRRIYLSQQAGLVGNLIPVPIERNGVRRTLAEILGHLEGMKDLGVVVIDPARSWIDGKEEDSEVIGKFLTFCQDLARHTGAAVVIVHHTKRRGQKEHLRSPAEVVANLRGSQVFIDRPRVVMGILRKSDGTTELGVTKTNLAHAIPEHVARLRFDPASELHTRVDVVAPAARSKTRSTDAADDRSVVTAAVSRLLAGGQVVQRTGKSGLHALAPSELAGWSRDRTNAAIHAAISAGMLAAGRSGLTIPSVPVSTVPE